MVDFTLNMGNAFDEIFPKIEEFSLDNEYFVEDDLERLNSYRYFDRNMEDYIEEHELD